MPAGRVGCVEPVADWVEPHYDQVVLDELRAAVDELNDGNVEPFVALISADSEWRGITSGHLWWKRVPS